MEVKYIIRRGLVDYILVFPDCVQHDVFAAHNNVSAGFIRMTHQGDFECYGKSVGLGLSSRGQIDSDIANLQLKPVMDNAWTLGPL